MIPVKALLEKQWDSFCDYVRQFAENDMDTNDEEYNIGRHEIISGRRWSIFDPAVDYYCTCNNLSLKDIPGGFDDIVRKAGMA